jgi:hypothetical protein
MGDWGYHSLCISRLCGYSQHKRARTTLSTAFLALLTFVTPEILVMNNKAGLRRRKRHTMGLFVIHQRIKMVMPRVHP